MSAQAQPLTVSSPAAREALEHAVRALDTTEAGASSVTLVLNLAQVGRCYRGMGDLASAEWYLLQALRWAHTLGAPDARIEIGCELAEVAVALSDELENADEARAAHDRARDHVFETMRAVRRAVDVECESAVLMRLSEVLDQCGDHDDAIAVQCRVLDLMTGQALKAAAPMAWAAPDTVM